MSSRHPASGPPRTSSTPERDTTTKASTSRAGATSESAAPSTTAESRERTPAPSSTPARAPAPATPASASTSARSPAPAAAAAATAASPSSPVATGSGQGPADHSQAPLLPASHWVNPPEEFEDDDTDSAYGDDAASSTASLSASILEYRTVHGRTFHSERGNAQSWNPNDAQHDESMDILHHVSTLMQDGKLHMADLDESRLGKVLDVGCGTGIWAIDFADQYPSAEVIGVDISPSQPQWIPPNLKFEIDDITQPWTYAPNSFDYIHMRWLIGAIPDWYGLFREVYRALKPGGIFESKESSAVITSDDGSVAPGSALDQWGKIFRESGKKFGRSFSIIEEDLQRKAMEAAGFVDIKVINMKTSLGPWPADPKHKEIGQYARLALEQDVEGFIVYVLTNAFGWTREEISVYAAHFRRELRSPSFHSWYAQRVVIGRKPY
ncbi:S-adenosyl-L-methionine-dependent methyltransferase [Xylariaceae sp. FL0594]|nr:S-adenosyl-L-methionine-dependent methyltransferase [Xylariaceae sp. FL0594]